MTLTGGLLAALLLQNTFHQLSSEALRVSHSATVSYIIEELIQLANRAQLTALLDQFSTDWETACCHQFASHVIQALVKQCGNFLRKTLSLHYSVKSISTSCATF